MEWRRGGEVCILSCAAPPPPTPSGIAAPRQAPPSSFLQPWPASPPAGGASPARVPGKVQLDVERGGTGGGVADAVLDALLPLAASSRRLEAPPGPECAAAAEEDVPGERAAVRVEGGDGEGFVDSSSSSSAWQSELVRLSMDVWPPGVEVEMVATDFSEGESFAVLHEVEEEREEMSGTRGWAKRRSLSGEEGGSMADNESSGMLGRGAGGSRRGRWPDRFSCRSGSWFESLRAWSWCWCTSGGGRRK
eukprot:768536-Hanusia_phi.AAC.20